MIYAGLSVEICAIEKLIHTGHILPDLMLAALSLPDDMALYETADSAALPGWEATPPVRFRLNTARPSCACCGRSA